MTATLALEAVTIRTANGPERPFYFRPDTTDAAVINDVFVKGGYDLRRLDRTTKQRRHADVVAFLEREQQRTGKRPLIVDAGANIGAAALQFLSNFPNARIVSIEPEASNYALLLRNTPGLDVVCMQAAVSAREGRVKLSDPGEGHWGFRTEAAADGEIRCVTINDIFRQNAATHFPFIVKIDIEGGEAALFSDSTEWVGQTPILIVELHDWLLPRRGISQPFLKSIAPLDRDLIHIGEDIYSISNVI
jgi:FkbM family methyltransferase